MEVVVLLVAIAGVALLVIPRVQRRKGGARRPTRARKPARSRGRKVAAAPLVAAPAVASWSPPAAAETAGPELDVWEDDLGWEGGEDAAPSPAALEAWEQWRTTDSPLAAAAAAAEAAEAEAEAPEAPELPSVERWRAQADEQEWVEDDDGLGWEGEEEPPAPRALWNGENHSPTPPASPSDEWSPAETLSPEPDAWNSGRDWSRRDETRAPATDAAPAFATASMTDVAPDSSSPVEEPELGRTIALEEDDEWDAPVGRSWGAPAPASQPVETAPRRSSRRSRVHPVLLVAVYAAVGIGAVVLGRTHLLGGSEPSRSAVTVAATATPTPSVKRVAPTPTPTPVATPDPAIAAAARNDFTRERTSAVRSHDKAVKAAIADRKHAVKKARERAARKRDARKNAKTPSPVATPTYTPQPTQQSTPTYKAPATKRRSVCEFCIG
jgi:hypothetical protein